MSERILIINKDKRETGNDAREMMGTWKKLHYRTDRFANSSSI